MSQSKRIALGVLIGVWALFAWQQGWLGVVSPVPNTADRIVVIEESSARTADHAVVLLGPTANSLRKADKWLLVDKDELPESMKAVVAGIKYQLPYILLYAGERKVGGPYSLPKTEAEFAAFIQRGG